MPIQVMAVSLQCCKELTTKFTKYVQGILSNTQYFLHVPLKELNIAIIK